jgi:rhodanese-related sulfurtransferase
MLGDDLTGRGKASVQTSATLRPRVRCSVRLAWLSVLPGNASLEARARLGQGTMLREALHDKPGDEMDQSKTAAEMVAAAKQGIENLSVDQVAAEIQDGATLLVDIRESEERMENGSIPGALHLPRGMLEFYADPTSKYHRAEMQPDRRIIVHCASGGRSALAVRTLQELGFANAAHLDGGITAWAEAGQPVQKEHLGM